MKMIIKPLYTIKERFTTDYHKNTDMEWLIALLPLVILAITIMLNAYGKANASYTMNNEPVYEDYTSSLPDYPMKFGSVLEASQSEMDTIYKRAKAISRCEGWTKQGSLSQRNNNPGNLKAGGTRDKQGHTIYETPIEGWNALHKLLYKHRTKTIWQLSRFYASASDQWYSCVTSKL